MVTNYFHRNLPVLRKCKGHSQYSVAEKLNVSRSTYSSWEEYRATPSLDKLIQISDFYGITLDVLLKEDLSKANN